MRWRWPLTRRRDDVSTTPAPSGLAPAAVPTPPGQWATPPAVAPVQLLIDGPVATTDRMRSALTTGANPVVMRSLASTVAAHDDPRTLADSSILHVGNTIQRWSGAPVVNTVAPPDAGAPRTPVLPVLGPSIEDHDSPPLLQRALDISTDPPPPATVGRLLDPPPAPPVLTATSPAPPSATPILASARASTPAPSQRHIQRLTTPADAAPADSAAPSVPQQQADSSTTAIEPTSSAMTATESMLATAPAATTIDTPSPSAIPPRSSAPGSTLNSLPAQRVAAPSGRPVQADTGTHTSPAHVTAQRVAPQTVPVSRRLPDLPREPAPFTPPTDSQSLVTTPTRVSLSRLTELPTVTPMDDARQAIPSIGVGHPDDGGTQQSTAAAVQTVTAPAEPASATSRPLPELFSQPTAQRSTGQRSMVQRPTVQSSAGERSAGERSTVQRSTVQRSTAPHSTAQHSTAQGSAAQYSAAQYSTAQHSTAESATVLSSTVQRSTAPHSTAPHLTVQPSTAPPSTPLQRAAEEGSATTGSATPGSAAYESATATTTNTPSSTTLVSIAREPLAPHAPTHGPVAQRSVSQHAVVQPDPPATHAPASRPPAASIPTVARVPATGLAPGSTASPPPVARVVVGRPIAAQRINDEGYPPSTQTGSPSVVTSPPPMSFAEMFAAPVGTHPPRTVQRSTAPAGTHVGSAQVASEPSAGETAVPMPVQRLGLPVEAPHLPSVPSVPHLPSVPSVPHLPSVPSVPHIPSVPSVPHIPSVPSVPHLPSVPDIPTPDSVGGAAESAAHQAVAAAHDAAAPVVNAIDAVAHPPAPGGGAASSGAHDAAPAYGDLEELARRLYEPLSARLRAELWLDRERAGILTDH
ncbi:hypothetical protein ACWDTI_17225 [Gordonia sp. NPDC003424]